MDNSIGKKVIYLLLLFIIFSCSSIVKETSKVGDYYVTTIIEDEDYSTLIRCFSDSSGNKINDSIYKEIRVEYYEAFDEKSYLIYKKGKYGVLDVNLSTIIPPIFDKPILSIYGDSIIENSIEGKRGLYHLRNKILIPYKYLYIRKGESFNSDNLLGQKSINDWHVYDSKFQLINKYEAVLMSDRVLNLNVYAFKKGEKFAIANENFELKSNFIFDTVYKTIYSGEKYYLVKDTTGVYLIDEDLNSIKPAINYDDFFGTHSWSGEYLMTLKNSRYGIINKKGTVVLSNIYDKIDLYEKLTYKESKVGLVNDDYEVVLPSIYDSIDRFKNLVFKDGLVGVYDDFGKIVMPISYKSIKFVDNNIDFIMYNKEGMYGLSYKRNNISLYEDIQGVYYLNDNLFKIYKDDYWSLFNLKKNKKTQFLYSEIEGLYSLSSAVGTEQLYRFKKDNLYGLFDHNGSLILSAKYNKISVYSFEDNHLLDVICDGKEDVFNLKTRKFKYKRIRN